MKKLTCFTTQHLDICAARFSSSVCCNPRTTSLQQQARALAPQEREFRMRLQVQHPRANGNHISWSMYKTWIIPGLCMRGDKPASKQCYDSPASGRETRSGIHRKHTNNSYCLLWFFDIQNPAKVKKHSADTRHLQKHPNLWQAIFKNIPVSWLDAVNILVMKQQCTLIDRGWRELWIDCGLWHNFGPVRGPGFKAALFFDSR